VGRPIALLALSLLAISAASAGVIEVQVRLQVPQKIDVTGMRRVLVGGFRAGDNPDLDVETEYVKYLRGLLKHKSTFDVIEADAPPLPEQDLADVVKNVAYWKGIAQRFSADLIIAGVVNLERSDRSGFVQEDIINPTTGQRYRRTRYAEREAFTFAVTHYFFKGETGELLYEGRLTEESVYEGRGNDALSSMLQLADRMSPEILGIVTPHEKSETRYLFTE
jgi:hypothetical protein